MSFEGYHQVLCKNGHHFTAGLTMDRHSWWCPACKEGAAWVNLVDTTNGSFDERGEQIDGYVYLEIEKEAVLCKCPTCQNEHVIEPVRYKIP